MALVKDEDFGKFEGISMRDRDLFMNNLQFADDTLIFCKPSLDQIINIKMPLRCFHCRGWFRHKL